MPTPPPDQPRDLSVERDLGGLRYTVATWEGALPQLAITYVGLLFASALGVVALLAGLGMLVPDLIEFFSIIFQPLYTMGVLLPLLLAVLRVHRDVSVSVWIDQNGMQLTRRSGTQQVTWAACEDVRRKGRLIDVLIDGRWRKLPSPNAYTDAAWLEGLIRDKIDARRGDAIAPPEEIAAALRALGAQSRERAR